MLWLRPAAAALLALMLFAPPPAFARPHHRAPVVEASSTGGDVVSAARSQIGNGPVYGRRTLWCARFMNAVLERLGYRGTGSDTAASFASLPRTGMHVGAIAVMHRRGGGHVGVVSAIDASGNPIIISGNNGGRVREATYPAGRVYAFVEPK